MKDLQVLLDAIKTLGVRSQFTKALEELTELNLAILHCMDGRDNYDNLLEEIVDAEIMIDQLKIICLVRNTNLTADDVNGLRDAKIARLAHRLEDRKQKDKKE